MYFSSRGTFISRVFPALRWSGLCLGRTSLLRNPKSQHISNDARCFNPLTSPNHRTFRKGMKGTYWPLFVLPSSFFIWTSWSAKEDVKRTWKIINFLNSMCDPFQLLHSFLLRFSATSENWNAWNSPQACQPLNKIQFLIINEIIGSRHFSSAACYTFHTGNWHCETPAGQSALMKFVLGMGKLKFLTICSVVWRKRRRQQREENVWFLIIFYAPLRFNFQVIGAKPLPTGTNKKFQSPLNNSKWARIFHFNSSAIAFLRLAFHAAKHFNARMQNKKKSKLL